MKNIPRIMMILLAAALFIPEGLAQTRDVRIDIQSGQGRRIRLHCESLEAKGSRDARQTSVQADELLASDLQNSAVFAVSRAWVAEEPGVNV